MATIADFAIWRPKLDETVVAPGAVACSLFSSSCVTRVSLSLVSALVCTWKLF